MKKYRDSMKRGSKVKTPDGDGVIIGRDKRRSSRSNRGCTQFVVRLNDGRIRHYSRPRILELNLGFKEMLRQSGFYED